MEPNENTLEMIGKEVTSLADNTKALSDSLQKDLHDVRAEFDALKTGATSAEDQAKLQKMTESVMQKQVALDEINEKAAARFDKIETAMNRPATQSDGVDPSADAAEFFAVKAAESGKSDWRTVRTDEIDVDGYNEWKTNFGTYIRASDDRELSVKALSVGSNPGGGYLIPTAQSANIIKKIYETSPMRQLATIETIGTSSMEIPIDTDEAGAGWVGEEQARTETATPGLGVQVINVYEVYAEPRVTQKFLEDASIDVQGWLSGKVASKMARTEATAFIAGDGINKPRGILSYPAGSAGARGTIRQLNSGGATTITADAVRSMTFQIKDAYLANAGWLMKRSTVQAVMLLKDSQNQWLWRPGLDASKSDTLAGYTVRQADDMPIIAAGSLSVAFGDMKAGYTIVDRLGITTLRDSYTSKPFVKFYSIRRVGGDVVDFDAFALMVTAA